MKKGVLYSFSQGATDTFIQSKKIKTKTYDHENKTHC